MLYCTMPHCLLVICVPLVGVAWMLGKPALGPKAGAQEAAMPNGQARLGLMLEGFIVSGFRDLGFRVGLGFRGSGATVQV